MSWANAGTSSGVTKATYFRHYHNELARGAAASGTIRTCRVEDGEVIAETRPIQPRIMA